jgi:hypothetical protein
MPSTAAQAAAEAILDDLRGAAYYQDSGILADFLEGRFGLTRPSSAAANAAEAIVADLRGAKYYQDPDILARFLDERLGRRPTSG